MSNRANGRGQAEGYREINLGIIITPMLDMSFQLLAFFVMIFKPPSFEGHIDGRLLPPEKLLIKGPATAPPTEKKVSSELDPSIKDAVLVVIKAYDQIKMEKEGKNLDALINAQKNVDGVPITIAIKTPESPDTVEVAGEGQTVEQGWEALLASLKEIQKTLAPLQLDQKDQSVKTEVKLMLDGNMRHKHVVKAWDICKAAGFRQVGFIPPTDLPPSGTPSFKKPDELP